MNTSSLAQRAMLVSFHATQWIPRKYDKKVSHDVAVQHNAAESVGRYNKNLLPIDAPTYKTLQQDYNATRTYHYEQTLPWGDDASRILLAVNHMAYTSKMRTFRQQIENVSLPAFMADVPTLFTNARVQLNGLWKQEDYPTLQELKEKFTFVLHISPLPDVTDWRLAIHDDELDGLRDAYEQAANDRIAGAMRDLYQRLFDAVSRMKERLSTTDAVFRDSLVVNIRELCELLPRLNLTGDATLEAMRVRIERDLAEFDADELRDSKPLRADIARKADKIQNDIAAMLGGKAATP